MSSDDQYKKKIAYKKRIDPIISTIQQIIANAGNTPEGKAEASDKIMKALREEYIYVKYSYFKTFESSDTGTIDPYSEDVKLELEKTDHEVLPNDIHINDSDYVKIPAYSFGPFNAEAYFNSKERFLWLLKEPYCENQHELTSKQPYRNDPDYYNQAKSYSKWKDLAYATHINVVKRTKTILEVLHEYHHYSTDENLIMNDVMSQICIIEVNHFPGLAFNVTNSNSDIKKWALLNSELIETLLDFYNPNIIICGGIIDAFIPEDYNEIKKNISLRSQYIWGKEIKQMRYMSDEFQNVFKNVCFLDQDGRVIVKADHPGRASQFSRKLAVLTAALILELIKR